MPRVIREKILSILSNQMRQIFDDLCWAHIMGSEKLVYSTVENTATIMWGALQSHEEMAELSKHNIKRHPSITSIFVCFLITANISEPLQNIY